MNNLKKFFGTVQSLLLILLLLVSMVLPTYASLHKGEYFIIHEKYEDAITTLEPFAAQNNPHALYLLSYIYLLPTTHHLNIQKGLALLEKAVSLNYAPAIDELAGLYLSGEGVEKNEEKALHYYLKGADAGYGPSQFNCGIMYKDGQGTTADPAKAYFYLCLASLNTSDLGDVTQDAAKYRDEVVPHLSPEVRQETLRQVNALTLPKDSRRGKS